jgi:hypothetical protein
VKSSHDRIVDLLFPAGREVGSGPVIDDCADALHEIASTIAVCDDDPGKLYPLPARVKRVVEELISIVDERPSSVDIFDTHHGLGEDLEKQIESIESSIAGLIGDPGHLYPLDERVRLVVRALRARAGVHQ